MKRIPGWLKSLLGLAVVAAVTVLIIVLLGQAMDSGQASVPLGQAASPIQTPAPTTAGETTPAPTQAQPTRVFQSPVQPTRVRRTPDPEYTPTLPPPPTLVPTPVVTPIPTVAPPVIPDVVGKDLQPFWIYYWQANEVWRVDSQGQDRELLLDTRQSLGQWLTEIPTQYKGTEFTAGPRVNVSPDGRKLALVVVDKIELSSKDEPFTFSIYVFDAQTGALVFLSEGIQPVWSPDGRHIAFLKQMMGGLWIADLESGQVYERLTRHANPNMCISAYTWSPDSTQIAYMYRNGFEHIPEILLVNADDDTPPRQLMGLDTLIHISGPVWSPDGQRIFFLSNEGGKDWSPYHRVLNLWLISLATGERVQLTRDMRVGRYSISPDDKWLLFPAYPIYEPRDFRDGLWLISLNGQDLRRVTANRDTGGLVDWSPDGTRLIVRRMNESPMSLSLESGDSAVLSVDPGFISIVGGVK